MIDSKKCPFCKKENLCEADMENNICWCNNIKVPSSLREYIPKEFQLKACICKNCITLYIKDKNLFIEKYNLTK